MSIITKAVPLTWLLHRAEYVSTFPSTQLLALLLDCTLNLIRRADMVSRIFPRSCWNTAVETTTHLLIFSEWESFPTQPIHPSAIERTPKMRNIPATVVFF